MRKRHPNAVYIQFKSVEEKTHVVGPKVFVVKFYTPKNQMNHTEEVNAWNGRGGKRKGA